MPDEQGLPGYPQKLCIRLWKSTLLTWQNQAGMRVSTICPLCGQNSTFAKSMAYEVNLNTNQKNMQDENEQLCA
jgi:hypothetical protein